MLIQQKEPFLSLCWAVGDDVGGIQRIEHFGCRLHAFQLEVEERLGHNIVNYIFPDRKHNSGPINTALPLANGTAAPTVNGTHLLNGHKARTVSTASSEMPLLTRSGSHVSVHSLASSHGLAPETREMARATTFADTKDSREMSMRSHRWRYFTRVEVSGASVVLSYRVRLRSNLIAWAYVFRKTKSDTKGKSSEYRTWRS